MENKEKYFHRDLSWLSFNERVLEEALDLNNPFLERLKFLAIFVNNLDEFFMVRLAGLRRLLDSGYNKKDKYGYPKGPIVYSKYTHDYITKVWHLCTKRNGHRNFLGCSYFWGK